MRLKGQGARAGWGIEPVTARCPTGSPLHVCGEGVIEGLPIKGPIDRFLFDTAAVPLCTLASLPFDPPYRRSIPSLLPTPLSLWPRESSQRCLDWLTCYGTYSDGIAPPLGADTVQPPTRTAPPGEPGRGRAVCFWKNQYKNRGRFKRELCLCAWRNISAHLHYKYNHGNFWVENL